MTVFNPNCFTLIKHQPSLQNCIEIETIEEWKENEEQMKTNDDEIE